MSDLHDPLPLAAPVSRHAHRAVLERFWRMFRTFMASAAGRKASLLFAGLLLLLVLINLLNVLNSYVGRNFMTAIEQRNAAGFVRHAWLMLGVFALAALAAVLARYSEERLGLLWRHWLTREALLQYMGGRVYQFIEETSAVIHPDQRISEDIRVLTVSALSLVLMLLNALFAVIAFSGVLWSISPALFLISIVYALMGSLLTVWLGRPLVKLNSLQLDREADLRTALLQVRENAEPIALLHQEAPLRDRLLLRLENLTANLLAIFRVNRRLGFFTNGYNYLIQIIPALLVAPLFIHGTADFGIIAQSALAFTVLVNAFSLVVSQFVSLSNFAAVLSRLSDLSAAIERARHTPISALQVIADPHGVAFDRVTLCNPDESAPLIQDLTIRIPQGIRVLVRSPGQNALTALFKATAGTGDHSRGTLHRPPPEDFFCLPEKPWIAPGTLRQTLLAGPASHPSSTSQAGLERILTELDLQNTIANAGGLDTPQDHWDSLLSTGEQKRLLLARLLLHSPRFALIDRLPSSLNAIEYDRAFRLLCGSPVTFIHLTQNDSDTTAYQALLTIHPDATWTWTDLTVA